MQTEDILAAIDDEIKKLQQARALLVGVPSEQQTGRPRGRRKGSFVKAVAVAVKAVRRTMTEEGKQRIAAAQKERRAAQKKTAKPPAKKTTVKKNPTKKAAVKKTSPAIPPSSEAETPAAEA